MCVPVCRSQAAGELMVGRYTAHVIMLHIRPPRNLWKKNLSLPSPEQSRRVQGGGVAFFASCRLLRGWRSPILGPVWDQRNGRFVPSWVLGIEPEQDKLNNT